MTSILLADDHSVVRTGMKMMIANFIPHCDIQEAFDGDSAFEKVKERDYDILILDVNMPNTDSFGLIDNLLALRPGLKVLMFSMNDEELYAKKYLKLGAMGYVKKDESHDVIITAINTVLSNKKYISPKLSQILIDDLQKNYQKENPFDNLSPREFEIAQHLMRGESPLDICNKLSLHSSTVGTYKARIFEKLNCRNVIDLNSLARVHNALPMT